jgi:hypothetical protein
MQQSCNLPLHRRCHLIWDSTVTFLFLEEPLQSNGKKAHLISLIGATLFKNIRVIIGYSGKQLRKEGVKEFIVIQCKYDVSAYCNVSFR